MEQFSILVGDYLYAIEAISSNLESFVTSGAKPAFLLRLKELLGTLETCAKAHTSFSICSPAALAVMKKQGVATLETVLEAIAAAAIEYSMAAALASSIQTDVEAVTWEHTQATAKLEIILDNAGGNVLKSGAARAAYSLHMDTQAAAEYYAKCSPTTVLLDAALSAIVEYADALEHVAAFESSAEAQLSLLSTLAQTIALGVSTTPLTGIYAATTNGASVLDTDTVKPAKLHLSGGMNTALTCLIDLSGLCCKIAEWVPLRPGMGLKGDPAALYFRKLSHMDPFFLTESDDTELSSLDYIEQ